MATETVTNSARAEVLRRIRAAKGGVASAEAARAGWSVVERRYRREATRSREAILELLEDRLRDYDARVIRVRHADVASNAAGMMGERKVRRMVVPAGLVAEWRTRRPERHTPVASGLSAVAACAFLMSVNASSPSSG